MFTRGPILAGLALLTLLVATGAEARKKVTVLSFSGPRGSDAARQVKRALQRSYSMVSGGTFSREARNQGSRSSSTKGRKLAAGALRVDAIVSGSVKRLGSRWVLKITVYSGHNGRRVGGATIPLRGARVDPGSARRVPGKIRGAIARSRAGAAVARKSSASSRPARKKKKKKRRRPRRPAAPAGGMVGPRPTRQPQSGFDDGSDVYQAQPAAPEPVPVAPASTSPEDDIGGFSTGGGGTAVAGDGQPAGGGDGLGFAVAGGGGSASAGGGAPTYNSGGGVEYQGVSRQGNARPSWESIVEISLGAMVVSRSFEFVDWVKVNPNHKEPPRENKWVTSAFHLEGAFYPISIFHRGPMAGLGITGRYYRVFSLRSVNNDTKKPEDKGPFNTILSVMELGLRYRWNILGRATSPTYIVGLDFGRHVFKISDGPDRINLPDIAYSYLNLALVNLEVPFYASDTFAIGAMGAFDYLLVLSSGDIENNDSTGYGRSSTGGVEAELGLYTNYKGFFVRANGFYRRMWFDFDPESCTGCKVAGGAVDEMWGGYLRLGYAY